AAKTTRSARLIIAPLTRAELVRRTRPADLGPARLRFREWLAPPSLRSSKYIKYSGVAPPAQRTRAARSSGAPPPAASCAPLRSSRVRGAIAPFLCCDSGSRSSPDMSCPLDSTHLDLVEGRLAGKARREVDQHLDGCVTCREILADAVRERFPAEDAAPH